MISLDEEEDEDGIVVEDELEDGEMAPSPPSQQIVDQVEEITGKLCHVNKRGVSMDLDQR